MAIEGEKRSSSLTDEESAELRVAAGLLEAVGGLTPDLTAASATERLRELLAPPALWLSGPMTPAQRAEPEITPGYIPRWQAPDAAATARSADLLLAACRAALPKRLPSSWGTPALRLQVPDAPAAQQLAGLRSFGPYLIVPSIANRFARDFSWRWPMRIGVERGARSDAWFKALQYSPYASLYEVRLVEPGDPEPLDIAFVDAASPGALDAAACVVLLGDASPTQKVDIGREVFHSPIIVGAAADDLGWFSDTVAQMAHDQPIDVALRIASPKSLILADTKMLPLTAARQWAIAMAGQLRRESAGDVVVRGTSPASELLQLGVNVAFDSEQNGASAVVRMSQKLDGQGHDTVVHVSAPKAMARPPPRSPPPPPPRVEPSLVPAPPRARRLIADAQVDGRVRRKTLLPKTDHQLLVRIAIPKKADTAAPAAFPEDELPAGQSVTLMVDVTSAELGLRERLPIVLSTSDRSLPSTTAVFKFRSKAEGSVVDIKILVTHQERPLQEAHYVATVRREPVTGDRARLNAVPLSNSPEPRAGATPADLSLEMNGANLERTSLKRAVDVSFTRTKDIQELLEGKASKVLADLAAPRSINEPAALALLIGLAREGSKLKKALDPLQIGDAKTISLLVDATTAVFPLELVYDRDAPKTSAKLCQHRPGGSMVGKPQICRGTGASVVCPYAFWGQHRVIARTIRLNSEPKSRGEAKPLALSPVLYAASKRADADPEGAAAPRKPKKPIPSDVLQNELGRIFGDPKQVVRAKNWTEWKRKIAEVQPQLLVLLGHTERGEGETLLEIGANSWLKDPDIRPEYLHSKNAPLPLVILMACATGKSSNEFGGLTAAFAGSGAGAIVATLTKFRGPQGASAGAAIVGALRAKNGRHGASLGSAMTSARQRLLKEGSLVGLLLVAHGEIDLPLQI
jgi:hypothetical protein